MWLRLLGDRARWLTGRLTRRAAGPQGRSDASGPPLGPPEPGSHRRPAGPISTAASPGPAGSAGPATGWVVRPPRQRGPAGQPPPSSMPRSPSGRVESTPGGDSGTATARAAIRTLAVKRGRAQRTPPRHEATRSRGVAAATPRSAPAAAARASGTAAAKRPWYERASASNASAGLRDCGSLERVLHRDWAPGEQVAPEVVTAIRRLAELPQLIKDKLVAGLEAIFVGVGGVPDLDDMGRLKGVPLPSGRATWDACAGAYGRRKIIIGTRPSPTPDVTCHEVGHALDHIDGPGDRWQSDAEDFCLLYQRCRQCMTSVFHQQGGEVGRREFFADAFAAIASGQRPALVDMLSGDTRAALDVMLYFNVRYGV